MNISEQKIKLRGEIRVKRNALLPSWVKSTSQLIQEQVINLSSMNPAKTLGCYLALPYEVQTNSIINNALTDNQAVVIPRHDKTKNLYRWAKFTNKYPTELSAWPASDLPEPIWSTDSPDIIIVPAVALDPKGNRLGHGYGHYDRLLSSKQGVRIGLCFEFQLTTDISVADHDIPMNIIITEHNIFKMRNN